MSRLEAPLVEDSRVLENYTLVCSCEGTLGLVGRFSPNAAGQRSVICMQCQIVTVIEKEGEIRCLMKSEYWAHVLLHRAKEESKER